MAVEWRGKPPALNPEHATKTLLEVKRVLDKHSLKFWLIFGTCLGAIRENGFIDIDCDIDLGLFQEDLRPKLDVLKQEFEALGYETKFLDEPYPYKRMLKVDNGTRVDLVDWFKWGNYYLHPVEPSGVCHLFPCEMFDTLTEIDFLGEKFNVPTPVTDFLELLFPNWMTKDMNYDFRKATCCYENFFQRNVKL